jgi:hypothetical protein
MCTDDRCPVVVGDILVYRDSHHLSDTFVEWLTPLLEAAIVPFVTALQQYRLVSGDDEASRPPCAPAKFRCRRRSGGRCATSLSVLVVAVVSSRSGVQMGC